MPEPSLAEKLSIFADEVEFPSKGVPLVRWGQRMRTTPQAARLFADAMASGRLVPLHNLAKLHSGLVTRANAYFIVEELDLSKIPNRFHITRRDLEKVAVIVDGKGAPHRIPRRHLLDVIKGPESLIGPLEILDTNLRLFSVTESQAALRHLKENDTLAYLRRGEAVDYRLSEDKMKGGIPAQRSNIKNRKPYWYSLSVPRPKRGRLVVPEHFDQRFLATALTGKNQNRVVIDTCYIVESRRPVHQFFLLAALNSLLTWYQIELRGRTQHGEGVLKVKIPDFEGILIPDPDKFTRDERNIVQKLFKPIARRRTLIVQEELQANDRVTFDEKYLELIGIAKPRVATVRTLIARELREAMAERRTRPESVSEMKAQRAPKQRVNRAIDAFAARIVAKLGPYPDPRHHIPQEVDTVAVPVAPFEGSLSVGAGLFDSGTVYAGSESIAVTDSNDQARFVRAVLTIDPALKIVDIPNSKLEDVLSAWITDVGKWYDSFQRVSGNIVHQIDDPRVVEGVILRALDLAHASELPEKHKKNIWK